MSADSGLDLTLPPESDGAWDTASSTADPPPAPAAPEPAPAEEARTSDSPEPRPSAPRTPSGSIALHGQIPEIPGFTFVRPLGRGGFSDVHLYRQHRPDRDVAVKIISGAAPTSAHRAAAREGDLMAAVSVHPSIVDVYGMGETEDGRPFLVMEYCPGPSLVDRLRDGPLPLAEALSIGVRLAGALETAHHWGVVHRDVKPSNVLTNQFGAPTLTDFGIAGSAGGDADPITAVSVPWSPPELLDAVRSGDAAPGSASALASDVYALAATVWTMLTARPPFVAEASAALAAAAAGEDGGDGVAPHGAAADGAAPAGTAPAGESPAPAAPDVAAPGEGSPDGAAPADPPPRAAVARAVRSMSAPPTGRRDVPAALELALARGMAKRPADRFATVADFGRELQRIEHELGLPSTTMDIPRVLPATNAVADPDAVPVPGRGAQTWEPQTWRESGAPGESRGLRAPRDLETENALLRVAVVILSVLIVVMLGVGVALALRWPEGAQELRQLVDAGVGIARQVGAVDPLPGTARVPAGGG